MSGARLRGAGLTGLLTVFALAFAGCGASTIDSSARQVAEAACLQASASIKDPTAKQSADQACRAVGSGDQAQLILAAKQAARQACLQASQKIADPTAQAAAKAVCPAVK